MSYHDKLIVDLTENKLSKKPRTVVMVRACGCIYYSGGVGRFVSNSGVYLYEALLRSDRCKTGFHRSIQPDRLWRVEVEEGDIALYHLVPRS